MTDSASQQPRQTLTYIKDLLRSRRLIPKSKMGQNFLIDLNLLDLVLTTAQLGKEDSVLEVGTGTGSLTARMGAQSGGVFTVELDPEFYALAEQLLCGHSNVRQMHGDALAGKNQINPHLYEGWDKLTSDLKLTRRKLIANLPYAIATPLIANLLISNIEIERMVVMVQWEVAERMVATVGTKDYGSLAILTQGVADVEIVRRIAPSNFWPRPAVDSAIVFIKPNAEKRAQIGDVKKFRAFLRDLYTHRRKNLRQALAGWPSGRKEKTEVDALLASLDFDGSLRAERLTIEEHLTLCKAFEEKLGT
jgi:16S rRNA (adenine1518-N6/adenine1519-N6)-dimethyltransferase